MGKFATYQQRGTYRAPSTSIGNPPAAADWTFSESEDLEVVALWTGATQPGKWWSCEIMTSNQPGVWKKAGDDSNPVTTGTYSTVDVSEPAGKTISCRTFFCNELGVPLSTASAVKSLFTT